MKRRIAALLAACIFVLLLTGCTQAGRRTAAQKFLNQDIVAIADCAREILETGVVPVDAHFDGVENISYARNIDSEWVSFITGSRRETDDTGKIGNYIEVGFYYSPDNEPMYFLGRYDPNNELVPDSLTGERYTCVVGSGDNVQNYYTEYMQVGWYYYEYEHQWDYTDMSDCSWPEDLPTSP